jgi:hypothetical protein
VHRAKGKDRCSTHGSGVTIHDALPYLLAAAPFAIALIVLVV